MEPEVKEAPDAVELVERGLDELHAGLVERLLERDVVDLERLGAGVGEVLVDQPLRELGRDLGAFTERRHARGFSAVLLDEPRELAAHSCFEQSNPGALCFVQGNHSEKRRASICVGRAAFEPL